MKHVSTLLLLFSLTLLLTACGKDEPAPEPEPDPLYGQLTGLWEKETSEWQYFDASGTAQTGLPWKSSSVQKYGFLTYGSVRITFTDGSGYSRAYEITKQGNDSYVKLIDGLGLGTISNYHIKSITDKALVLVASYDNVTYWARNPLREETAKKAVNTITLVKK